MGWSCFMDGNRQMPKHRTGIVFNCGRLFVIHNADCMHYVVQTRPDEAHCIVNILPWFGYWSVKRLSVYAFRVNALYLCNMIDKNVKGCISLCNVCCCHENNSGGRSPCAFSLVLQWSPVLLGKREYFMWTVFFVQHSSRDRFQCLLSFPCLHRHHWLNLWTEIYSKEKEALFFFFFLQTAYCRCYTNV